MSLYKKKEWIEFRDNVIESDGFKCTSCGRSNQEVTLQVHHKIYLSGKLPWEYATNNCITLCKGCHAAEHGIVMPKTGWEYGGHEDLGDLIGTCENCGTPLRYSYSIYHPNWGYIEVGTLCCDNLTGTDIASNGRESLKRYESRKDRFINSKRWKKIDNCLQITQALFEVKIEELSMNQFSLCIHNLKSSKIYEKIADAKNAAFDVIESGELIEYLDKKNIPYRKK